MTRTIVETDEIEDVNLKTEDSNLEEKRLLCKDQGELTLEQYLTAEVI